MRHLPESRKRKSSASEVEGCQSVAQRASIIAATASSSSCFCCTTSFLHFLSDFVMPPTVDPAVVVPMHSSNPLFLHSSDHPGLLLVSKTFDGFSFGSWKRAMSIVLSAKNKLGFVDGTVVRPTSSPNLELWKRCNNMVISWILNTLSSDISESKSLSAISQGNDDVATYFTKIKAVWDELNAIKPIPPCICGTSQLMAKHETDHRLMQFLMGLNPCYNMIRGNIITMKPHPSISEAYDFLIQDEKQREFHSWAQFIPQNASMNASVQVPKNYSARKGSVCSHCKKPGHDASKCYRLIGFPKDFKFTRPKAAANAVFDVGVTVPTSGAPNALSSEQYNNLLQLFQQNFVVQGGVPNVQPLCFANFAGIIACNSTTVDTTCIIDTGASNHMCFDFNLLSDVQLLNSLVYVLLPNRHVLTVTQVGTVNLTKTFSISNVLFVPQFKHNLLFVPKLCRDTKGLVQFSETTCFLQAPSLSSPLVLGDLLNGLYLLNPNKLFSIIVDSFSHCNSVVSLKLWHTRLGHLSLYKLKQLNVFTGAYDCSIEDCSICPKARHHKLPFASSSISSSQMFDLIHIDTWGPYRSTFDGYKNLTIVDDFTRTTWTHLLTTKGNAFTILQGFIEMVETRFSTKVKRVRSDNAFELGSGVHHAEYFKQKGIIHQTTCPGVPQQNGVVERKHKHLLETARAFMFQSNLPITFWGECVLTSTHFINISPHGFLRENLLLRCSLIKDLGTLNYFLGIEVLKSPSGLIMTQRKFVKDLLTEFPTDDVSSVSSPLPLHLQLKLNEGQVLDDPLAYRRLVGKLNYLTHTWPDLAFAVQFLSQFMSDPRVPHWDAMWHTLRYVKGTCSQGLFFNNDPDMSLSAYCDSDWAAFPNTQRSVSGYFICLGGSPISWKSKKQPTVSLSSAEAGYHSLRRVTRELAWLTSLFMEFRLDNLTPVPLKCDSQAAIHIAKNLVFHERTKHIELDCHFVRDKLQAGLILLSHTRTFDQLVDLFTKSLAGQPHSYIFSKLGLYTPPT
ncbi:hypothetical protein L1987_71139 [Smallanthus sonchifolius]|uniref:Uncharacterized protein n=1 Tax=Smallanthus sonchifolius TaxID=185202 RepID=A0ACB9ARL9_9ASTR|nr:hypothetical protein L1987_71139 [Smallanthus sonchifolius]